MINSFSRNKIQEGDKRIGEVLDWYEEVNSQTLNYVTFSIHDSDISDFYRCEKSFNRLFITKIIMMATCLLFCWQILIKIIFSRWIIGYKNLLRAVEFSGVAGILGLEYLSAGNLSDIKYQNFLKSEALRREYLNQSFNFLPFLEVISILAKPDDTDI